MILGLGDNDLEERETALLFYLTVENNKIVVDK
jgi:hypothetical protein